MMSTDFPWNSPVKKTLIGQVYGYLGSLTGGAGSPIWFIGTRANKTVGLGKTEVSAAAVIHPTEVGT